MSLELQSIGILKTLLCLGAIPAVFLAGRLAKLDRILLPVMIVMGMAAYFNFGAFHPVKYPHSIHYYDMYHYYFGGKYFAELGYFDLYSATVAADQDGPHFFDGLEDFDTIRDLRADELIPWHEAEVDFERIRARFSNERWTDFQADLVAFQTRMPSKYWAEAMTDYGFNASPIWVMTGGLAANLLSAESLSQLIFLGWLDVLLMSGAFVLLYKAFGLRVLAFSILLFGLNYTQRYQQMSGSLLRLDWLACLISAMALLKMRRENLAGVLLGWATMLRVFPALFLVGIAVRGLYRIYRGEAYFNRDVRTMVLAMGTAGVLFAGSLAMPSGLTGWNQFASNIGYHTKRLTVKRIALPYVLMYNGETTWEDVDHNMGDETFFGWRWAEYKRAEWAVWMIRIALLAGFVAACMRCRSWQALALGLALVWGFANPARYYWCHLVLIVPLLMASPRSKPRLVAAAFLFLIMASSYVIDLNTQFFMIHQFHMSFLLGILLIATLVILWKEKGETEET